MNETITKENFYDQLLKIIYDSFGKLLYNDKAPLTMYIEVNDVFEKYYN